MNISLNTLILGLEEHFADITVRGHLPEDEALEFDTVETPLVTVRQEPNQLIQISVYATEEDDLGGLATKLFRATSGTLFPAARGDTHVRLVFDSMLPILDEQSVRIGESQYFSVAA